jgi:hypothetical protein
MAGRPLAPAVLRTIDDLQLGGAALGKLIDELGHRAEGAVHTR